MDPKCRLWVLCILVILGSFCVAKSNAYSAFTSTKLRTTFLGKLGIAALVSLADYPFANAVPPFLHRRVGPTAEGSVEESDEDEDNESQARVEPQITPLNRDDCLAKLLCGMSVPVTGGGSPKNNYYSEYAQTVAKFFEAFPLEDDENKSAESLEAYDDYSIEDDRPVRQNSKKKKAEKYPGGLQLIDLALIKTAKPEDQRSNQTGTRSAHMEDDDERNDRSIARRLSRARKVVEKLGEKLQTVRQCQQISGCPFTFKQLRSKLKSKPSISSNVPLGNPSINYKPASLPLPVPSKSQTSVHALSADDILLPFRDPNKGDDELEEIFGPQPVQIKRPPGFGLNQMLAGHRNKKRPALAQVQQSSNQNNDQYIPYNPPVSSQVQNEQSQEIASIKGPMFPKKKLGYKIPSYVKRPTGENDEFDDVNKSTGPVSLIGTEHDKPPKSNNQQQQPLQQSNQQNAQAQTLNQDDGENDESEDDYDDDNDYEGGPNEGANDDDTGGSPNYDDDDGDSNDTNEEDDEDNTTQEEDESKEQSSSKKKVVIVDKNKQAGAEVRPAEDDSQEAADGIKKKINYKRPSVASILIEDAFDTPQKYGINEDDELQHPDNLWSKLTYATSAGLAETPKKDDSTESKIKKKEQKESSENDKDSDESEEDEEDEEDDVSNKSKVVASKHTDFDDEEVEAAQDALSSKKYKGKGKANVAKSPVAKHDMEDDKAEEKKKKRTESSKTKSKTKSTEDSEEEPSKPSKFMPTTTMIGGRPIVPPSESETAQTKKTSPLSRFKFNLVRPYGSQSAGTGEGSGGKVYQQIPSLPSYSKPKPQSSSGNRFRNDVDTKKKATTHTQPESYLPAVSFGSSNGGKHGTVEYLGAPNNGATQQSNKPTYLFPFSGTLSTFTRLFQRPGSGGNQDIPGTNSQQSPAVTPFIHRPVGPESNKYRRGSDGPSSGSSKNKTRRDSEGKKKKSSKKSKRKNYY